MVNNENLEVLVGIYLKGDATPEQAIALEEWKAQGAENAKHFEQLEKLYAITHKKQVYGKSDTAAAWKKVAPSLQTKSAKMIPLWQNKNVYIALAASLLIGIVLLGDFWKGGDNDHPIAATDVDSVFAPKENTVLLASNAVQSFTLKDESVVELQPGSRLIVDKDFNTNRRYLELEGSGKFRVKHDEENPFIVKVSELEVFDLGTVFRIQRKLDTVKVFLDEGSVELRLNGEVINMEEGDSAFYAIKEQVISRYKDPVAREDHMFEFDGTSLKEVASILSAFYNRKIVIVDKGIEACPLSVTFKNEELATILDIVKELMDVQIEKKNDIIEIYGEECN